MPILGKLRAWFARILPSEERRMRDPVYALLRRELDRVGKEFEQMSYERFLEPPEVLSFSRVVDGIEITFSAEAFTVRSNGDIGFCIDADAHPACRGAQPSYVFFKSRDGAVHY